MPDNKNKRDAFDSKRMALAEQMSRTDALALHHIKMSASFAEAYPEESAEYSRLFEEDSEIREESADIMTQWDMRLGEFVRAGDEIPYGEDVYIVIQDHTLSAEWCPPDCPALFRKKQGGEWPDWVQPTGASDAYSLGAKVSHIGKHWVSSVANNVWKPGVYGWDEVTE